MTDRELFELAAKAAGLVISDWYGLATNIPWPCVDGQRWNPIGDDGDALRLAVKVSIQVDPRKDLCWARSEISIECAHVSPGQEGYEADIYAATRRAIVRAAAQIGAQPSQGVK